VVAAIVPVVVLTVLVVVDPLAMFPQEAGALQVGLPVSTVLLTGLPCAVSVPLVQRYVWVTVVVVGCVPP